MRVPREGTGGTNPDEWVRRVWPWVLRQLRAVYDLSSTYDLHTAEGFNDANAMRAAQGLVLTAWLGTACSWGAAEYNYNVGALPCVPLQDCTELAAGVLAAAFDGLDAALRALLAWVRQASSRASEQLSLGWLSWWVPFNRAIGRAVPSFDVAEAAYRRVIRATGEPRAADHEIADLRSDWTLEASGVRPPPVVAELPPEELPPEELPGPSTPPGRGASRGSSGSSGSTVGPFVLLALGWAFWFATGKGRG